jgi:hypothetical protein
MPEENSKIPIAGLTFGRVRWLDEKLGSRHAEMLHEKFVLAASALRGEFLIR